jgi:hypothetical protein
MLDLRRTDILMRASSGGTVPQEVTRVCAVLPEKSPQIAVAGGPRRVRRLINSALNDCLNRSGRRDHGSARRVRSDRQRIAVEMCPSLCADVTNGGTAAQAPPARRLLELPARVVEAAHPPRLPTAR